MPFGAPETAEERLVIDDPPLSALDALVKGTIDGVPVLVGIVATLVVAVAFVALINAALGSLPHVGDMAITLQRIFAWPFRPVMWLIGLPWDEAGAAAT